MTWLGKILTVLVLLLSLAWMWFTVSVYAARTNWKNQSDMYKKAYDEARNARETEIRTYQSEKDSLERRLLTEQSRSKGLAEEVTKLQGATDVATKAVAEQNKVLNVEDIKGVQLSANLQAALDELRKVRDRSNQLEDERVKLVIAKEQADKDKQSAENIAKQAVADKLLAEQRVETLNTQLAEARSTGGSAQAAVLGSIGGARPAALPEGIRGTVTAYRDGYVAISVGIDAGVTIGAVLDVFRTDGGGDYLGTIVVERVYPKEAVGRFIPKDERRQVKNLRAEELPKVGDTVGKLGSGPISIRP